MVKKHKHKSASEAFTLKDVKESKKDSLTRVTEPKKFGGADETKVLRKWQAKGAMKKW